MAIYCISDIHLGDDPHLQKCFIHFLDNIAHDADAIYILGDLFELWLGDDLSLDAHREIITRLQRFSYRHIPIYIMAGNRDFLLGQRFIQKTGCLWLHEPTVLEVNQTRYLLVHGDSLCLSDIPYQRFRRIVRYPLTQWIYFHLPKKQRIKIASACRKESAGNSHIIDIDETTLKPLLQNYHCDHIIHGHTHLPAIHLVQTEPAAFHYVLSDWGQKGHYAVISPSGEIRLCHFSVEN